MDTLRLSDADREAAVDLLGEQYAVGRLDKDEFDERSDAVWSAKSRGDLVPVFADLPSARQQALPARTNRSRTARMPLPLIVVLAVLAGLTVATHLPFLLLAGALWLVLSRRHRRRGRQLVG